MEQKKVSSEFNVSETTAKWIEMKLELSDILENIVNTYQSMFNDIPDSDYEILTDAIGVVDNVLNTYMVDTIEANIAFKANRNII